MNVNSKIKGIVLATALFLTMTLLLLASRPLQAQSTEEASSTPAATATEAETQEATPEVVLTVVPPDVDVIVEVPAVDDFEVTNTGDAAYVIVLVSAVGSFVLAAIMGIRQGNLAGKLAEALVSTTENAKTSEGLERQFMRLPSNVQTYIKQFIDVADPASDFTATDLDGRAVRWARNLTDGNLETGALEATTPSQPESIARG